MNQNDLEQIKKIKSVLSEYDPMNDPMIEGMRPASVLIPFYFQSDKLSIIFMKRPDYQGVHGGQISFPGGAKDSEDESDLQTALRETEEEIGVKKDDIEVWGRLKVENTRVSKYWVHPFIGIIPSPYCFQPSANEVERLIIIPFDHLLNSDNFSVESFNWEGQSYMTYIFTYKADKIWGLTARILYNFITLLTLGQESAVRFRKTEG